jgi:hypothetical protein
MENNHNLIMHAPKSSWAMSHHCFKSSIPALIQDTAVKRDPLKNTTWKEIGTYKNKRIL